MKKLKPQQLSFVITFFVSLMMYGCGTGNQPTKENFESTISFLLDGYSPLVCYKVIDNDFPFQVDVNKEQSLLKKLVQVEVITSKEETLTKKVKVKRKIKPVTLRDAFGPTKYETVTKNKKVTVNTYAKPTESEFLKYLKKGKSENGEQLTAFCYPEKRKLKEVLKFNGLTDRNRVTYDVRYEYEIDYPEDVSDEVLSAFSKKRLSGDTAKIYLEQTKDNWALSEKDKVAFLPKYFKGIALE